MREGGDLLEVELDEALDVVGRATAPLPGQLVRRAGLARQHQRRELPAAAIHARRDGHQQHRSPDDAGASQRRASAAAIVRRQRQPSRHAGDAHRLARRAGGRPRPRRHRADRVATGSTGRCVYRETKAIVVSPDHYPLCDRSDRWIPADARNRGGCRSTPWRASSSTRVWQPPPARRRPARPASRTVDVAAVGGQRRRRRRTFLREQAILFATGGRGKRDGATDYPASTIWHTVANRTTDGRWRRRRWRAQQPGAADAASSASRAAACWPCAATPTSRARPMSAAIPAFLPGGHAVGDATARAMFAELWSGRWNAAAVTQNGFKPLRELPTSAGLACRAAAMPSRPARSRRMLHRARSRHKWAAPLDAGAAGRAGQAGVPGRRGLLRQRLDAPGRMSCCRRPCSWRRTARSPTSTAPCSACASRAGARRRAHPPPAILAASAQRLGFTIDAGNS